MRVKSELRIASLSLANFAVGTGAFIISGILPMVAGNLNLTIFEVGQTATAFTIAFALGGPLLASPTSGIDRRSLLVGALLLFTFAAVLGAFAPNYGVLIGSRVLGGIAGSLITPHAATTASLIVDADRRGRAVALVLLGFAASTVFGVPLGTILGDTFGWRAAFAVVGLLSFGAAVATWLALPGRLETAPINWRSWREVFVHHEILLVLGVTLFQVLGQATVLTYLAVLLHANFQASSFAVSSLLTVFGGAGIAGTYIASRLIDRVGPAYITNGSILLMSSAMFAWYLTGYDIATVSCIILIWGLGSFAVNSAQQFRLIAIAPALATASVPLNSSSSFLGQALGALIGGAVVSISNVALLPLLSGAIMIVALCLSILLSRYGSKVAVLPT